MADKELDSFVEELSVIMPDVIRWFHVNRANALTQAQINPAQFFVLQVVVERGPQKMSELAQALHVSLPAVTKIADKLFGVKMVDRVFEAEDRRVIKISITAKGKRIVTEFMRQRKQVLSEAFSRLSGKDCQDYLRVMKKLHQISIEDIRDKESIK